MADICQISLLGLTILSSLLTGTTGYTRVFSSSGENVSLRCKNAHSGCTWTTWNFNNRKSAVELFAGGKKKDDIERREKLSLGSDCSLNISKATEEDHGLYTCQQFENGHIHGTGESVSLHVLSVSLSSSSSVTLLCQLFSYEPCDTVFPTDETQLVWENQAGVNLQKDSRYQIMSQGPCISTLTKKLLNEDNTTELRCLIKNRTHIKTSANYTVRFRANTMTTTNPDNNTSFEDISTSDTPGIVIYPVIAALVVVLAAAVLWMICRKRAVNRDDTFSSVVNDKNENIGTCETINISSLPTPSTEDVTYSEVTASCKKQVIQNSVHCDDKVTYASIKRATN